jgi:hypothetical protein
MIETITLNKNTVWRNAIIRIVIELLAFFLIRFSMGKVQINGALWLFLLIDLFFLGGEVLNLIRTIQNGYEGLTINGQRSGLLVRVGLLQRTDVFIPFKHMKIEETRNGLSVSYAEAYRFHGEKMPGGQFFLSNRLYGETALTSLTQTIRLRQDQNNVATDEKNSQSPSFLRRWGNAALAVLLVVIAFGLVFNRNAQHEAKLAARDAAMESSIDKASAKLKAAMANIFTVTAHQGATIRSYSYDFTVNNVFLATNENQQKVLVVNLTAQNAYPGSDYASVAGLKESQFRLMPNWTVAKAKASDKHTVDQIASGNILRNGQVESVGTTLGEGYQIPLTAGIGEKFTFNIVRVLPEDTENLTLYYAGFPLSQKNKPNATEDKSIRFEIPMDNVATIPA